MIGSPFERGRPDQYLTSYLCGLRHGPAVHSNGVVLWAPHNFRGHISHEMCWSCALLRERRKLRKEHRRFTTMTQDLKNLATWLRELGVTHIALESTGVYFALSSALIGRVQVPPALG